MRRTFNTLVTLAACTVPGLAPAQQFDFAEQLFARACSKCHGATAEVFVDQSVTRFRGVLVGAETGISVEDYLQSGHGKLTVRDANELVLYLEVLADPQ